MLLLVFFMVELKIWGAAISLLFSCFYIRITRLVWHRKVYIVSHAVFIFIMEMTFSIVKKLYMEISFFLIKYLSNLAYTDFFILPVVLQFSSMAGTSSQ